MLETALNYAYAIMTGRMELLQNLNPQQQQAILARSGPILVLAGPGSGKTRVLTHRIAHLIQELSVNPFNVLAVTFTNKAAREMENRVVTLIGQKTRGLSLGTFHANCARILRREADSLPIDSNFIIFDSDDQLKIVKKAIQDLNLDVKSFRPASVHHAISKAKNELYFPDSVPIVDYMSEQKAHVYQRYQELLLTSNAVDFDDLLLWTVHLLENNPQVRERYARRYEHVLVDEFQDTNVAQYTLLKHLTSFHHNLFVVGDIDQSIYRWRGADYRNLLRFKKDFPDTEIIKLEQNYRSTQAILDVAMAVINQHPHRTSKQLVTDRGQGVKAHLIEAYDDREEASIIVDRIASNVARKQYHPGDFAIMYRTNAQSRLLEEAFLRAGLPYKLVGAQRFYGRREIKDVISYLRLAHNPQDEVSLTRIINVPPRGIGEKTFLALRTLAGNLETTPGNLLLELRNNPESFEQLSTSKQGKTALSHFGSLLANWGALEDHYPPLALMDLILENVDYRSYIDDGTEEGYGRWENILELRRLADESQKSDLRSFLEQIALITDQDTINETTNVPTLLTLHAAKGLEFPVVMIAGLNERTLPHSRSFEDPEEMMEERRLFYVGITRAKDQLYLLCTQNRTSFGFTEPAEPSQFLDDIPDNLIDGSHLVRSSSNQDYGQSIRWDSGDRLTQKALEPQYHPGMRVQHPNWGEGMVLSSSLQDNDEIVDIFFENLGMKKVSASIARLQIMS